jgi:Fur family transcriptional regulator, ferric uptake regulator
MPEPKVMALRNRVAMSRPIFRFFRSRTCEVCKSTHQGQWRELTAGELSSLDATLREHGHRLTLQRQLVFETILGCPGHICAEHILAVIDARRPGLQMDKTTVYRTLDLLVELGLVREHRCGDGAAQYEPAARGPHSHLLCSRCNTLYNLDESVAADFRATLVAALGFAPDLDAYPIHGLCAGCRAG